MGTYFVGESGPPFMLAGSGVAAIIAALSLISTCESNGTFKLKCAVEETD